jgi:Ca2+-transporting ATPase
MSIAPRPCTVTIEHAAADRRAVAGGCTGDDDALRGLTSIQAEQRARDHGPNAIAVAAGVPGWVRFVRQFDSPLIWLLAAGCAMATALGEAADAVAILAIVLLNGAIGFAQERRAERAIGALQSLTAPRARVRRDGQMMLIAASSVVPGDVLLLDAGDVVAADAHLLETHNLAVNEAVLTGESAPAEKTPNPPAAEAPLPERRDRLFMGTAVVRGTGAAQVIAIGMDTELGRIATLLHTIEETETPLQRRLAGMGRSLLYGCLGIVAVVAASGLLRGRALLDVLLSAVALAVAAVPEGLPAVVTIALAVSVQRLAARHVLIRRLPAVETLGCATVICTDKTGTLTTGAMRVRDIWAPDIDRLLFAAAACCDAELHDTGGESTGDPTEIALLIAAAARGIFRREIEARWPRTTVEPFDAASKRMAIARADGVVYVKGALETVRSACIGNTESATVAADAMAARGLRVLAIAAGPGPDRLELLGLAGLADPPRPEAIAAVAAARRAGITTVMITGDNPTTARAIAQDLGILGPDDDVEEVVHARAAPQDKLAIVRHWKDRGAVVAMTGDGVNDAPALREAHIGVAMGRSGTEVTREASDIVLADDNFASVIAAVREGRGAYENIRKTLVYLLAGNVAELTVMLAASLAGLPLPLLPVQLLWINMVTDALPAIALVMDPIDADVLRRPPRSSAEPMLGRAEWWRIGFAASLEAAVTLAVFTTVLATGTLADARSAAFTTLVLSELLRAFAARSPTRLFWQVGALTNLRLLAVIACSIGAQAAIHHVGATQALFGIVALTPARWLLAWLMALVPVSVLELRKLAAGRAAPRATASPAVHAG